MLRNRSCASMTGVWSHLLSESLVAATVRELFTCCDPERTRRVCLENISQGTWRRRPQSCWTTMACAKFTLDLSGDFGKCKCGYAKAVRFAVQPARCA